jgi:hypothetical protein
MNLLRIEITGPIWKYPGPGGWCFVSVGDEDSKTLKHERRINRTAYGYVPISVTLGSSAWETTLFPSKNGPYLLAIKASVRVKERVGVGDEVKAQCVVKLSEPPPDAFR